MRSAHCVAYGYGVIAGFVLSTFAGILAAGPSTLAAFALGIQMALAALTAYVYASLDVRENRKGKDA